MNASDLMTKAVESCSAGDNLQRAVQIMWEHDCGVVPVVDGDNRVVGMITDRDVAIAAYTQGRPLWQIPVSTAMAKHVHGVRETDDIAAVEMLMRRVRVRRVPVLDAGGRLTGIVSMNDLARHAHRSVGRKGDGLRGDTVVQTLAAICEPRATSGGEATTATAGAVHAVPSRHERAISGDVTARSCG
jgi:CBS domain-containing protein